MTAPKVAAHTPGPFGPWFMNDEGSPVVKRQMYDADGNAAGYQLLDGDYSDMARLFAINAELLATLRGIIDMCNGWPIDAYALHIIVRQLARDAIAKAQS